MKIVFTKAEIKKINSMDDETRHLIMFMLKSGMMLELCNSIEKIKSKKVV